MTVKSKLGDALQIFNLFSGCFQIDEAAGDDEALQALSNEDVYTDAVADAGITTTLKVL